MKELEKSELQDVKGGFLPFLGGIILGGLVSELLFEGPSKCWADFKRGFNSI